MNTTTHIVRRIAFLAYGAAAYALFAATFAYAIGFVGGFVAPKTLNSGVGGPIAPSIAINVLLLSLFVVQHTIMARPAFKRWWTKIIPKEVERSTFVLATCLVLLLIFWQWRPLPAQVWAVENQVIRGAIYALFALGWLLVLYASFLIDHFDLFGLRQVILYLRGRKYEHPGFADPWLYRLVRNPLMLGFLIAFWAAPTMTLGHLMFAALTTGYIFMGIQFEERDLEKTLGEKYRRYRETTPMIIPWRLKDRVAQEPAHEAPKPESAVE